MSVAPPVNRQAVVEYQFNFRRDTATIAQNEAVRHIAYVYFLNNTGQKVPVFDIQVDFIRDGIWFLSDRTDSTGIADITGNWGTGPDGIYLFSARTTQVTLQNGDILLAGTSNVVTVIAGAIPPIIAHFQDEVGNPVPQATYTLLQGTTELASGLADNNGRVIIPNIGLAPEILPYHLEGFLETSTAFYNPLITTNIGKEFVIRDRFVTARTWEMRYKIVNMPELITQATSMVFGPLAPLIEPVVSSQLYGFNLIFAPILDWVIARAAPNLVNTGIRIVGLKIDPVNSQLILTIEQKRASPVIPVLIVMGMVFVLFVLIGIITIVESLERTSEQDALKAYYESIRAANDNAAAFDQKTLEMESQGLITNAQGEEMRRLNRESLQSVLTTLQNPPKGEPVTWQALVLPVAIVVTLGAVGAVVLKELVGGGRRGLLVV